MLKWRFTDEWIVAIIREAQRFCSLPASTMIAHPATRLSGGIDHQQSRMEGQGGPVGRSRHITLGPHAVVWPTAGRPDGCR